jgi:hypothetical protein
MWGRKAGDQPISQSASEENYVGLIRSGENSQPFLLASVSQSVINLCIVSLVHEANGLEKAKPAHFFYFSPSTSTLLALF